MCLFTEWRLGKGVNQCKVALQICSHVLGAKWKTSFYFSLGIMAWGKEWTSPSEHVFFSMEVWVSTRKRGKRRRRRRRRALWFSAASAVKKKKSPGSPEIELLRSFITFKGELQCFLISLSLWSDFFFFFFSLKAMKVTEISCMAANLSVCLSEACSGFLCLNMMCS